MRVALCFLALVGVVIAKQFYDAKFENINVDEVLQNPKIIKNYANCFLEKGPCNSLTRELREIIKDAMRNVCDRCSPKQIKLIRTVIDTMRVKEPHLYNQVLDHFDPTKKLRDSFNVFLRSHN